MPTLRRSAALAAALCAAAAHAGLTITTETKRKGGNSTLTMQFEGKNLRTAVTKEGSAEPSSVFISDGDNKKMVMIDFAKKEYVEITQEQVKRMKAKMETAMSAMKAQMAKLPPEQRKQMEAAMGQRMNAYKSMVPEEKYTRASGSKKIAGHKCDLYKVEADGQHTADACLVPWSDLKIDRDQFKQAVDAVVETWSGLGMGMGAGEGGAQRSPGEMLKAWGMSYGLPAWRKTVKPDESDVTETTLTSIDQGAVPRSAFEAPAGFTKKTMDKLDKE